MRQKLSKNLGLKLLSLLIAVILWITIMNVKDPLETKRFTGIPVQIINEELVAERDKIPVTIEGDKVDVVVEARRTILDSLSEKDFLVTADFSKISFMDAVPIDVSLPGYSEEEVKVIRGNDHMMKLVLDDYVTKSFGFDIRVAGEAAEGYFAGDAVASPNVLRISGADMIISKIKEVVIEVDVTGFSSDISTTAVPKIYDMNGDLVDTSKLTFSVEQVAVTVPALLTKEIRLRVNTVGDLPDGYEITESLVVPDRVTVAGTKEDLEALARTCLLKVDVTGLTGQVEKNVSVAKELNEELASLKVVDDISAAVTITISPYGTKQFTVPAESIGLRNLQPGYTAEILAKKQFDISITGKEARLKYLTEEQVRPYVDLTGCAEGIHHLEVMIQLPSGITQETTLYADVFVRRVKTE